MKTVNFTCKATYTIKFILILFPGSNLRQIIDDSHAEVDSSSSDFWVMVAALKVGESRVSLH